MRATRKGVSGKNPECAAAPSWLLLSHLRLNQSSLRHNVDAVGRPSAQGLSLFQNHVRKSHGGELALMHTYSPWWPETHA